MPDDGCVVFYFLLLLSALPLIPLRRLHTPLASLCPEVVLFRRSYHEER